MLQVCEGLPAKHQQLEESQRQCRSFLAELEELTIWTCNTKALLDMQKQPTASATSSDEPDSVVIEPNVSTQDTSDMQE